MLLDLHMPGMSGFDVLAVLERDADAPAVIAIIGHDDAESTRRALLLHALECQHKPIGADVQISAIERARRRSRHGLR